MEELRIQHGDSLAPHRHNDLCQVVLVEHGRIQVQLDDKHLELGAPSLVVVPAPVVHAFKLLPGTRGKSLTVSQGLLCELAPFLPSAQQIIPGQYLVLDGNNREAAFDPVIQLFDAIQAEYTSTGVGRTTALFGLVMQLLALVARLRQGRQHPGARSQWQDLFHKFSALVEKHFCERWSMTEYATAMLVNERTLHRMCQRITGITPGRFVQQRIMLEAKRNLLHTDKSIAEVGYALGFEDPAYFTRFFHNNAGITPSQYRQR